LIIGNTLMKLILLFINDIGFSIYLVCHKMFSTYKMS
jgi:hypothetical protein